MEEALELLSKVERATGGERERGPGPMSKREARLARLATRLWAVTPSRPRDFEGSWQLHWATDPETFRRNAMDPRDPQGRMRDIMESPIPMKILRYVAFEQLRKDLRQKK